MTIDFAKLWSSHLDGLELFCEKAETGGIVGRWATLAARAQDHVVHRHRPDGPGSVAVSLVHSFINEYLFGVFGAGDDDAIAIGTLRLGHDVNFPRSSDGIGFGAPHPFLKARKPGPA
jgi:hypothetical protein